MVSAILYLHGVGQQVRHDEWYEALASSLEGHGIEPPPLDSPRIISPDYVDLLKLPPRQRVDEPDEAPKATSTRSERLALRAAYAAATKARLILGERANTSTVRYQGVPFAKPEGIGEGSNAKPAPGRPDYIEQLEQLAKLRDNGILSEEEFAAKKADILRRI